jgi:UDP-2,3-diacylglucosamine hydrolase
MPPALFVSDLHLSPSRPALVAAFERFCAGPARDAAAVYVLGDLFDSWIGDDQVAEPASARVVSALRRVADAGIPVSVARGNRDFLLGEAFARAASATLLPEQVVVDLYGSPTLLSHGDELCTDDLGYLKVRAWRSDPARQRRFLALPYFVRRAIAAWFRLRSRGATMVKSDAIMDVNAGAVAAALRAHRVRRMIHGHTHRPAHHRFDVDGAPCERIVLADWYGRGSYLEVDEAGARSREIA